MLLVKRKINEIVKVCHQSPIFNNFSNSCDLLLNVALYFSVLACFLILGFKLRVKLPTSFYVTEFSS